MTDAVTAPRKNVNYPCSKGKWYESALRMWPGEKSVFDKLTVSMIITCNDNLPGTSINPGKCQLCEMMNDKDQITRMYHLWGQKEIFEGTEGWNDEIRYGRDT